ncbi:MAG: hypothetical protein AAF485_23215, partial [Chloroflexota bacterium]
AIKMARGYRPDIVFLNNIDVGAPEACVQLKTDRATANIPVVILVEAEANAVIENNQSLEADAYIMQPFSSIILFSTIEELSKPQFDWMFNDPKVMAQPVV